MVSKWSLKVKLCNCCVDATPSKLWSKCQRDINFCKDAGNVSQNKLHPLFLGDLICATVKTWHIGYAHPYHNGNPHNLNPNLYINGLMMTIPQSVKISYVLPMAHIYISYKTRPSWITLQSQNRNPSTIISFKLQILQFQPPSSTVCPTLHPTLPPLDARWDAPTGTWADAPGPGPRRAQRCRSSSRSARRGTPRATRSVGNGGVVATKWSAGFWKDVDKYVLVPIIYIYIFIYLYIYICVCNFIHISISVQCLCRSMLRCSCLVLTGNGEDPYKCNPKIGFHLTILDEILMLPLFPPRSFSSKTAFKLLASL